MKPGCRSDLNIVDGEKVRKYFVVPKAFLPYCFLGYFLLTTARGQGIIRVVVVVVATFF